MGVSFRGCTEGRRSASSTVGRVPQRAPFEKSDGDGSVAPNHRRPPGIDDPFRTPNSYNSST